MPPNSTSNDTNAPGEQPKSFLSRFSSPLSKRSAKIFELEIEPEHPHKIYRPGDSVRGQVVLTVFKGFDITHLTISLHGYARVFKNQCTPREANDLPDQLVNGKGSHGFEYFGNGLASLFQDEQTLCGSGFLKKQVYKFGFDLQFPTASLPSSMVFERGTVNYMISASATRPVAIGPITNKFYPLKFLDWIDVEPLATPKTRAIYLEPMSRRGKVKKVKQTTSSSAASDSTATQENRSTRTLSRQNTSTSTHTRSCATPLQEPPLSPTPSEDTELSFATTSTHSLHADGISEPQQRKHSGESVPQSSTTSSSAHTISATTEIQKHGVLPGESVTVRVKVEHTKVVRGLVLATLYRLGRIDMLPALPIANRSKDRKPEYEDVYPKSRTGLGGLYFTNGAPNMAFRNDLTQSSTMMVIDPTTKTADFSLKVRVPNAEIAFPTMGNVPGGMISFTYHIEVVVDLTGKLGEARLLPHLTTNGFSFSKAAGDHRDLTHDWTDSNILDTAPLRRTKNVATFDLPLIVGTDDSGRARRAQLFRHNSHSGGQVQNATHNSNPDSTWVQDGHNDSSGHYDNYGYDAYSDGWYDEFGNPIPDELYDHGQHPHYTHSNGDQHDSGPGNRMYFPPPEHEEPLDEKERLQRHEASLLPSQPPEAEASAASIADLAPSAPVFPEDDQIGSSPPSLPITISRASARSAETIVPDPIMIPPPSLPEDITPTQTEDKQELERRRLEAQASAPPVDGEDGAAGPSNPAHIPSAPFIDDDAEYLARALRLDSGENLPEYQR